MTRKRFSLLLAVCLAAAAFCLAGLLHELTVYHTAERVYNELRQAAPAAEVGGAPPSLWIEEMQARLPGMVGWLRGAGLDHPVMQAGDNDFYLTHLADGTPNKIGAVFLDCANAADFSAPVSVVYGHDLKNGGMFGALQSYKRQSYYDEHPTLTLLTPETAYTVDLLAAYLEDGTAGSYPTGFDTEEAFFAYLGNAAATSFFQSTAQAAWGDRLLILSTCTYEFDNARLALVGRLRAAGSDSKEEVGIS